MMQILVKQRAGRTRCRCWWHRTRGRDWAAGRAMVEKMKELIPGRHMLLRSAIHRQAAIGGKVIARETRGARCARTSPLNAIACDITRKRKLLEKQKGRQKKMRAVRQGRHPAGSFIAGG